MVGPEVWREEESKEGVDWGTLREEEPEVGPREEVLAEVGRHEGVDWGTAPGEHPEV